jgi:hypothetical protein
MVRRDDGRHFEVAAEEGDEAAHGVFLAAHSAEICAALSA